MSNINKILYTPVRLRDKENKFGLTSCDGTPGQISRKMCLGGRSSMQDVTDRVTDTSPTMVRKKNVSDSAVSNPTSCKYATPSKPPIKLAYNSRSKSVTMLTASTTPLPIHRSAPVTPLVATPQRLQRKQAVPRTPDCYNTVIMETPNRKCHRNENDTLGEASNLLVAVRVRPMNSKELSTVAVASIVAVDNNEVTVLAGTTADSSSGVCHSFQYDLAFWSCDPEQPHFADQLTVFEGVALPLMDKAFEGYNACLFAYGQTGSGKSYSMMGIDPGTDEYDVVGPSSEAGIIPRFCHELFRRIETLSPSITATVEVSYFEIYNEKIHDLLAVSISGSGQKAPLKVREHPELGPYVVDLSTQAVNSHLALRKWLAVGNSQRATAATGMNDKSSRSHSIFSIVLNVSGPVEGQGIRSKVSLVDLAGSERLSHTCASGDRLREGVSINKSLLTLGKVIAALSDKRGAVFVPYRESVLTWLLRESLGGNSRTSMLATISPASGHLDETMATLRYACQARTIINRVRINEDPHEKLIRELRAEVDRLRALRQDYERQKRHSANAPPTTIIIETVNNDNDNAVEALRQQLAETEDELKQAQKSWKERLREAHVCQESEMKLLRRRGVALELSSEHRQPCLVNLTADPMLSGTLLYLLPPGKVRVGRSRIDQCYQPDIMLDSPLVAYDHCSIENVDGELTLETHNVDAETFVNGQAVSGRVRLKHRDRLVIGGNHYFRVSNPYDIDSKDHLKDQPIDFEHAHQEIMKAQERMLRSELKAEKERAIAELEKERLESDRQYESQLQRLENNLANAEKRRDELESQARNEDCGDSFFIEKITPYKSTFLKDLAELLGEEIPSSHSLHELNLMVREASQRCHDCGLDIIFKQTQILGPNGMVPMIAIKDKQRGLSTDWAPSRLEGWLNRLREGESKPQDILDGDMSWQEESDPKNESLNSSRISLNVSLVRDSFLQKSATRCKSSLTDEASMCVQMIHSNAAKLRKICHEQASRRISGAVSRSVDEIESILENLKTILLERPSARTPKSVRFLLE